MEANSEAHCKIKHKYVYGQSMSLFLKAFLNIYSNSQKRVQCQPVLYFGLSLYLFLCFYIE